MTERLTLHFIAIMHGDPEIITEGATLEAETREGLVPQVIEWMEECTEGFRVHAETPEQLREQASQLLARANGMEGYGEPATKVKDELPEDVKNLLGKGWGPVT